MGVSVFTKALGVMRIEFNQMKAYLLTFIVSLAEYPLYIFVSYLLWSIVYANVTQPMPMTFEALLSYIITAYFVEGLTNFRYISYELSGRIRQGSVAIWHVRPISVFQYVLLRQMTHFGVNAVWFAMIFALTNLFFNVTITNDPITLILGLISIFFAFCIEFSIQFIMGASALWIEKNDGPITVYNSIVYFISGFFLPFDFFPQMVQEIFNFLPFQYTIYIPTKIMLGFFSVSEITQLLGIQIFWIILFFGLAMLMWKRGSKRFTGYGV